MIRAVNFEGGFHNAKAGNGLVGGLRGHNIGDRPTGGPDDPGARGPLRLIGYPPASLLSAQWLVL